MPHAAEKQIPLLSMTTGNKKNDRTPLIWTDSATEAFEHCRKLLEDAVMLSHLRSDAQLSLVTDASNVVPGAALNQIIDGSTEPLGYFSKKFSTTQQKYSTYDRELTAIYMAIKHFRDLVEGRDLHILTDHKPIIFAFKQRPEKATPRQINYLSYISQFTTDIRHIKGEENTTADILSRVEAINTNLYEQLADDQQSDEELQQILVGNTPHTLKLMPFVLPGCKKQIYCDTMYNRIRPFITKRLQKQFLHATHPSERFIWPDIRKDSVSFAKTCIPCQKTKIQRHNHSELQHYQPTPERFSEINIDILGPFSTSRRTQIFAYSH